MGPRDDPIPHVAKDVSPADNECDHTRLPENWRPYDGEKRRNLVARFARGDVLVCFSTPFFDRDVPCLSKSCLAYGSGQPYEAAKRQTPVFSRHMIEERCCASESSDGFSTLECLEVFLPRIRGEDRLVRSSTLEKDWLVQFLIYISPAAKLLHLFS